MTFKPGQSGNPVGRPKITPEEREAIELARTKTSAAVKRLAELAGRDDNPKAAVLACRALLERTYGRPPIAKGAVWPESVSVSITAGQSLQPTPDSARKAA